MSAFRTARLYIFLAVLFYKYLHQDVYANGIKVADSKYRSKFAIRIENHQLIVDVLEKKIVESELDCILKCTSRKECLSFDMSRHALSPELWNCYLLSSDHYKHDDRLVSSEGYDHFYFQNACSVFPCHTESSKDIDSVSDVLCRITTSDPEQSIYNYNWTVDVSGGANGSSVEVRGKEGSQFYLHTPGLDPSGGNVSFELAGFPNHYVVGENQYILIKVYEDNEEFKRKSTFNRLLSSRKQGYETLVFREQNISFNPHNSRKLRYNSQPEPLYGDITWFRVVS